MNIPSGWTVLIFGGILALILSAFQNRDKAWARFLLQRSIGPRTDRGLSRKETALSGLKYLGFGLLFAFLNYRYSVLIKAMAYTEPPLYMLAVALLSDIFCYLFYIVSFFLLMRALLWEKWLVNIGYLLVLVAGVAGVYYLRWSRDRAEISRVSAGSFTVSAYKTGGESETPFMDQVSVWRTINPVGRFWPEVVFSGNCASSFSAQWSGENRLVIECNEPSGIRIRRDRYEGIAIEYKMRDSMKEAKEAAERALKTSEGELP